MSHLESISGAIDQRCGRNRAFSAPWRVVNEVRRIGLVPLARIYFALHNVKWKEGWRIFGLPLIQRHRGSVIEIGSHLQMRNWFSSNPLGVTHRTILATRSASAGIYVGSHVGLSGATICAESSISIGERVRIGANSVIVDTDFHPLVASERLADPTAGQSRPVTIENDVFIGMHAIILKGSHIGEGSVIGAGSVVSGKIPAGVIAAGNPARVIKSLGH